MGAVEKIDKFNKDKNDQAAIFLDTNFTRPAELVAQDIAHEVGHALGLFHEAPVAGGIDVMSYDTPASGTIQRFNGTPVAFGNPYFGNAQNGDNGFTTQNEMYHLLRYTFGLSDSYLRTIGYTPGDYDLGSLIDRFLRLFVNPLTGNPLFKVAVVVSDDSDKGTGSPLGTAACYIEELLSGQEFLCDLNQGDQFEILASTSPTGDWNVKFGYGDSTDPNFLFTAGEVGLSDGTLYLFDGNMMRPLGGFSATDAEPVATVPEPGTLVYILIAMVGIMVLTRRSSYFRRWY